MKKADETVKTAPDKGQKTPAAKEKTDGKVVPMPQTGAEAKPRSAVQEAGAPARTVEIVTLEIKALHRQAEQVMLGYAIEIGRRLVEVKAMLPHGEWGCYLEAEVEYSQSTANNFMRIFEEYGASQQSFFGPEANSQTLGNLPYSKALALIALPSEEREGFVQEHDTQAMSTRELQAAIKEKLAAETQAKTAEEARAKMEEDMRLANEQMARLNQETEQAAEAKKAAERAREAAEQRVAELRAKLEELEKRPVEVAVEAADPAELERARAEGRREAETELKETLAAAEKTAAEAAKVRESLEAAKAEVKAAKESGEKAQAGLEAARAEAERLKKALKMAGSKKLAAFEVYFQATQKDFTLMLDQLKDIGAEGNVEDHNKLVDAARALLEALGKQVPEKIGGAV